MYRIIYLLVLILFFCFKVQLLFAQKSPAQQTAETTLVNAILKCGNVECAKSLVTKSESFKNNSVFKRIMEEALKLYRSNKYDDSLLLNQAAREIAIACNNEIFEAEALHQIGLSYTALGELQQALDTLILSKNLLAKREPSPTLIYVLKEISIVHREKGEYQQAKSYIQQSLEQAQKLKDDKGMALAKLVLATILMNEGDFISSVQLFNESRSIFQKLDEYLYLLDCSVNLAIIQRWIGNYNNAVLFLNEAEEVAERINRKDRKAWLQREYGLLFGEQGDYEKALFYFNRSLNIVREIKQQKLIAENLADIAFTQISLKQDKAAEKNFEESLKISKALSFDFVVIISTGGLGVLNERAGDLNSAELLYKQAIEKAEQVEIKFYVSVFCWYLARLKNLKHDYRSSMELARRAYTLAEEVDADFLYALAKSVEGEAFTELREYEKARSSFDKSIERFEKLRLQVAGYEYEKYLFLSDIVSPYRGMIDIYFHQGENQYALEYAEKAKGRVLYDVLKSGKSDFSKLLTQEEREIDKNFKLKIISLQTQVDNLQAIDKAKTEVDDLKKKLDEKRADYDTFRIGLYSKHPNIKMGQNVSPELDIKHIKSNLLDEQTAILEYAFSKDALYVFIITKSDATGDVELNSYNLSSDKNALTSLIKQFAGVVSSPDVRFLSAGRNLYDILIKPIQYKIKNKTRIYIIPDEQLWEVPFQALISADKKFLLEDHAISYAFSIASLLEVEKQSKKHGEQRPEGGQIFAAGKTSFRDVMGSKSVKLQPLPEVGVELKELSYLYKSNGSLLLQDDKATEGVVKQRMQDAQVLHFATHGVLDDNNPMRSFLIFSKGNDADEEDGRLEAGEIMQMNLKADFAVLSACETARGKDGVGEGLVGMTWAFALAGVPTVVASQWKVDSKSTAKLMVEFHKEATKTSTSQKPSMTALSLRNASLKIMAQLRKEQAIPFPYYWAGFISIGNGFSQN